MKKSENDKCKMTNAKCKRMNAGHKKAAAMLLAAAMVVVMLCSARQQPCQQNSDQSDGYKFDALMWTAISRRTDMGTQKLSNRRSHVSAPSLSFAYFADFAAIGQQTDNRRPGEIAINGPETAMLREFVGPTGSTAAGPAGTHQQAFYTAPLEPVIVVPGLGLVQHVAFSLPGQLGIGAGSRGFGRAADTAAFAAKGGRGSANVENLRMFFPIVAVWSTPQNVPISLNCIAHSFRPILQFRSGKHRSCRVYRLIEFDAELAADFTDCFHFALAPILLYTGHYITNRLDMQARQENIFSDGELSTDRIDRTDPALKSFCGWGSRKNLFSKRGFPDNSPLAPAEIA